MCLATAEIALKKPAAALFIRHRRRCEGQGGMQAMHILNILKESHVVCKQYVRASELQSSERESSPLQGRYKVFIGPRQR